MTKLTMKLAKGTALVLMAAGVVVPNMGAIRTNADSVTDSQLKQGREGVRQSASAYKKQGFVSANVPSTYKNVIKLGKKKAAKLISNKRISTKKVRLKAGGYIYRNRFLSYANHYTGNYTGVKYATRKSIVRRHNGKKAVYYYVHNQNVKGWVSNKFVQVVK